MELKSAEILPHALATLLAAIEYPDMGHFQENVFVLIYTSRVQSVHVVGESKQLELTATGQMAGHMASAVGGSEH